MKKLILILNFVLYFTSCATKNVLTNQSQSSDRNPASLYEVPKEFEGKDFFKEHDKLINFTKEGVTGNHKISTFMKWVRNNPIELFELLRKNRPIFETGEIPFVGLYLPPDDNETTTSLSTVVVTLDNDVREILNNPNTFSVRLYRDKIDKSVGKFMLAYDNQKENMEKQWMRNVINKNDLQRISQLSQRLAKDYLQSSEVNGRVEIVNAIARRVPIEITRQYFGFEGADLKDLYRWSRATQYSFFHNAKNDGKYDSDAIKAGKEMREFLTKLIDSKKSNNTIKDNKTVLDRLLTSNVTIDELLNFDDGRIKTNIMGTLVGGIETTQAAIVQSLNVILKNHDILKKAIDAALKDNQEGDEALGKIIWEALRFDPINPFIIRYAEKDAVIAAGTKREFHVKKGQVILVATQSAMFDDSSERKNNNQFALNLKRFDTSRGGVNDSESIYYHFGFGHHKCLGDLVAEVEVVQIVKEILKLKNIRKIDGQIGEIGHYDNINFFERRENPDPGDSLQMIKDLRERVKSPFPESFVIEFDPENKIKSEVQNENMSKLNIPDPRFAFEEYLVNYDRDFFRECLTGDKYESKLLNLFSSLGYRARHFLDGSREEDLLLCRLPKSFHDCIGGKLNKNKIIEKYNECRGNLNVVENAIFRYEILGEPLDELSLPEVGTSLHSKGFEFEKDLKFYDRSDYRRTFLNPLVIKSFPVDKKESTKKLLFYARVDYRFRSCAGGKVLKEKKSRTVAFNECMAEPNLKLDDRTAKYYREIMLADEAPSASKK